MRALQMRPIKLLQPTKGAGLTGVNELTETGPQFEMSTQQNPFVHMNRMTLQKRSGYTNIPDGTG